MTSGCYRLPVDAAEGLPGSADALQKRSGAIS